MIIVILLSVFAAGLVIFLVLRRSPEEPLPKPRYPQYSIDHAYAMDQSNESNVIITWSKADTTAM